MEYVFYEFRKLFSIKYIWIITSVFLGLTSIFAFFSARSLAQFVPPSKEVSNFFELYENESDEIDNDYKEYKALLDERLALILSAHKDGNDDIELPIVPNKYSNSIYYGDDILYDLLYGQIDYISSYSENTHLIVNEAEDKLRQFDQIGVSEKTYSYKYQKKVIDVYEKLSANVSIGFEYPHGWDAYFSFDVVNIFIFATLLVFSSVIFTSEESTGMFLIIKTTRNGRMKTARSKIITIFIVVVIIVLIFSLVTWAIFGLVIGYGSPYNAIQAYPLFSLCFIEITVFEYFVFSTLIRMLTFSLFAFVVLFFSTVFHSYVITYIYGLTVLGVSYVFKSLPPNSEFAELRYLNLFSSTDSLSLYSRFRAINIFGTTTSYLLFWMILSIILIIIFIALFVRCFNFNSTIPKRKENPLVEMFLDLIKVKTNIFIRKKKYSTNILPFEIKKLLIGKRTVLIIAVILIIKCIGSITIFTTEQSMSDTIYKEYLVTLEGVLDGEKEAKISSIRYELNNIISRKSDMQMAYRNGELNAREYEHYLDEYYTAEIKSSIFERIENKVSYIKDISSEMKINGMLLYDTGWLTLFDNGIDVTLYVAIILLFTSIFAQEYDSKTSSSGFSEILKSTKNGRMQTFSAKIKATVLLSVAMSFLWNIIEFFFIALRYDLPLGSAPVRSIEMLSCAPNVSIFTFTMMFFLTKILAAVCLALLVAAISELVRRYILIMTVTVSITLLPFMISKFGVAVIEWIDFISFIRATPVLTSPHGGLTVATFVVITVILMISAKRSWNK